MHIRLPNDNRPGLLPLLDTPRRLIPLRAEIQSTPQRPRVPLELDLVLHRHGHPVQRAQRLPILVPLRRRRGRRADEILPGLDERDRVRALLVAAAPDQRQQSLDDRRGRQLPGQVARVVVGGGVVGGSVAAAGLGRGQFTRRLLLLVLDDSDGDDGRVVAGLILVEVLDVVDDVEAGVAPEVVLDEAEGVDAGEDMLACIPFFSPKDQTRCIPVDSILYTHIDAPISNNRPRNTGIDCVSFT